MDGLIDGGEKKRWEERDERMNKWISSVCVFPPQMPITELYLVLPCGKPGSRELIDF